MVINSVTLFAVAWFIIGGYGYWLMARRLKSWLIPSPFIIAGPFSFLASQLIEEARLDGRAEMYDEFLATIHRWINKGGALNLSKEGGEVVEFKQTTGEK